MSKDARDFNKIETRAVIKFFLQGKAPKEIHAILTETLPCFLPGRAKDLSAPLYVRFIRIPCSWMSQKPTEKISKLMTVNMAGINYTGK